MTSKSTISSETINQMADTKEQSAEALPSFSLTQKKKSKKTKARAKKQAIESTAPTTADGQTTTSPAPGKEEQLANATPTIVANEDEEYPYEVLLHRLYEQVEKGKAKPPPSNRPPLEPPIALRFGGARTVWSNFSENCAAVNRPVTHVLAFTLTELGTTGSIGEGGRLTVRGIFRKEHFASIIRKYIQEYVVCPVCKVSQANI